MMATRFVYLGICLIVQLAFSVAEAAIPKDKTPASLKAFLAEGSFRGGNAGIGFSILSMKRVYSTDGNSESLILEFGDRDGQVYSGKAGYFHAQLFRNPSELSLDLSQMVRSKVTPVQIKNLIKKSKLIQSANLESDIEDHSTNITMRFKSPVKMRVFTLSPKKKSPKLVLDITKL